MTALMSAETRVAGRPRFRLGPLTMVWRPRLVLVNVVVAIAAFLLFCTNVGLGDFQMSIPRVVRVLFGGGTEVERLIVVDLRLPSALVGVLVGIGLGISGAITQSVTRNPLASPDILGITAGASVGAVAVITSGGVTVLGVTFGVPIAAIVGALLTATVIYVLSWRRGIEGFRLILIGIAINAVLVALIQWLLILGAIGDVARATVWLNGSLNGRDWTQVWIAGVAVVVVGGIALAATFPLSALKLGDDTSRALGVRVQSSQAVLLIASVLLAALCVAAAGPIGFVAFVAPQLTVRIVGTAGPPLLASGLMGAVLVMGSSYVVRVLLPVALPVGVVTTAIGGPFLLYLVIRTNRRLAR